MSIEFITLQTAPLNSLNLSHTSGWENNDPYIFLTSDTIIPQEVEIQSLLHPTDLGLNATQVKEIFDDMYDNRGSDLVYASGCYYEFFETRNDVEFNQKIKTVPYSQYGNIPRGTTPRFGENDNYIYSYAIRYKTGNGALADVYEPVYRTGLTNITSMPCQPDKDFFFVESSGVIVNSDSTRLHLNLYHDKRSNVHREIAWPLMNIGEGQTAYELKIVDRNGNWQYDIYGNKSDINGAIPANNTYTDNNILIDLPFTKVNNAGETIYEDYNISLRYRGRNGDYTKYITFDTRSIRRFDQEIIDGPDIANDNSIKYTWKIEDDDFLVNETMTDKRRLSLDIYDIALTSNNYYQTGRYESRYYAVDNPLYTMFLVTKDNFPLGIESDSIKYYVKFGELDPIRISPSNRDTEHTIAEDGSQLIIPKLMVLDKLEDNKVNPEVQEVKSDEPIYTFKIIIEFDVSKYVNNDAFIPPAVDSYECHVTDRKSFLRV